MCTTAEPLEWNQVCSSIEPSAGDLVFTQDDQSAKDSSGTADSKLLTHENTVSISILLRLRAL